MAFPVGIKIILSVCILYWSLINSGQKVNKILKILSDLPSVLALKSNKKTLKWSFITFHVTLSIILCSDTLRGICKTPEYRIKEFWEPCSIRRGNKPVEEDVGLLKKPTNTHLQSTPTRDRADVTAEPASRRWAVTWLGFLSSRLI